MSGNKFQWQKNQEKHLLQKQSNKWYNILVSKKEPYGNKNSFKYFIGYYDNDVIRPLCIRLPQILNMLENLMKMQQCLS